MTGQLEKALEEEHKLLPYVRQENASATEWGTAHERIDKYASVSIDGTKVLLRDDGYWEVLIALGEIHSNRWETRILLHLAKAA